MNQHSLILRYLKKHKKITPYQAFEELGITKLSTRISEMRAKGIKVQDVWCEDYNRFGERVRYKKYFL